jgi:hypothetical protein
MQPQVCVDLGVYLFKNTRLTYEWLTEIYPAKIVCTTMQET